LGIIQCSDYDCKVLIRPQTTKSGRETQIQQGCHCGEHLIHISCEVRATVYTWKGGKYFIQDGVHNHNSPPINIHLNPDKEAQFDEIVLNHPNVGPSGLQLGIPTLTGPGKSVKDLSHALHNCGRVIYQRSETRKKFTPHDPTIFFSSIKQFAEDHPYFIKTSRLGLENIICMQTPFMAFQALFGDNELKEDTACGMVVDAAHSFWEDKS